MLEILTQYVPENTVNYCLKLWEDYQFDFLVSRPRNTKLGDFRWQTGKRERISVNGNLNQYSFLITYLHEVAHLEVYRNYTRRQPAHGKAWKSHFRKLLIPVMTETNFPLSILIPLLQYSQNPTASTATFPPLIQALHEIDKPQNLVMVKQIALGDVFIHQQKSYIRGEIRRTRVLCTQEKTKKQYLFVAHAWVEKMAPQPPEGGA